MTRYSFAEECGTVDECGYMHSLDLPPTLGSTSSSPSPPPSPSSQPPHFSIPATLQPHPLPQIPVQYQPTYGAPQRLLALPPPAPHGPRSPRLVMHHSHMLSPERSGFGRSLLAAVPSDISSEAPNGGTAKPTLPLGIVVQCGLFCWYARTLVIPLRDTLISAPFTPSYGTFGICVS